MGGKLAWFGRGKDKGRTIVTKRKKTPDATAPGEGAKDASLRDLADAPLRRIHVLTLANPTIAPTLANPVLDGEVLPPRKKKAFVGRVLDGEVLPPIKKRKRSGAVALLQPARVSQPSGKRRTPAPVATRSPICPASPLRSVTTVWAANRQPQLQRRRG